MHCSECAIPMTPRAAGKKRPAGARWHRGRGLCERCYSVAERAGTLRYYQPVQNIPREEPTPEAIRRTRIELNAYVQFRRNRGVPATGAPIAA